MPWVDGESVEAVTGQAAGGRGAYNVCLVIPSIFDGLLSSCCESDALVGFCCRPSLLGLVAWRQNPVFLPYPDGWHGDQARRDWVCWRQLQSQEHSATMKAVVHTVHLAHSTRPQHAVGKHYGLSAHSCRGALTKHGGRVVA